MTARQLQVLRFIHARIIATGISPSYDEMASELKLRSKSGIHRIVTGLENLGVVRRHPSRARSVEVLLPPPEDPKERLKRAVRAACTAMEAHLECTFPECGCKGLPIGISAAIAALIRL